MKLIIEEEVLDAIIKGMSNEIRRQETEIDNLRQEVEYYKSRLKRWEDWANPSDNWGCYS